MSFEHNFLVEKNTRKNEKQAPKYEIESIADLENYMFRLTEKLKENIDNDEYDTLIGDDASGRIPTLVLREVINERRKETHPGEEIENITTKFIAGGKGHSWNDEKRENLKPILEKIKKDIQHKALVVTEHMHHSGVAKMTEALNEAGINFDLAVLSSLHSKEEHIKDNPILGEKRIYIGEEDAGAPNIYAESSFSGVRKEHSWDALASRYGGADQNDINEVRKEIKTLAERTIRNVWGTSKK